jgi:hypothetical protein
MGTGLTFEQVLTAAQGLLVDEGFDGPSKYLTPKKKSLNKQIALDL